jgi:hypothetical protein
LNGLSNSDGFGFAKKIKKFKPPLLPPSIPLLVQTAAWILRTGQLRQKTKKKTKKKNEEKGKGGEEAGGRRLLFEVFSFAHPGF